jgi:hypothetical protein
MTTKSKELIRAEQQFLYTLQQIVDGFPQYTISQHLLHFLRQKSEKKEPYFWSTTLLLQKIEQYYDELKELMLDPEYNEDDEEDY